MKSLIVFKALVLIIFISCSSDKSKQVTTKRFKEPNNTAVFTTKFVITDKKDITLVTHNKEDGAWEFFSNDHFDNFEDVAKVVGLGEIVKIDNTLLDIADLPEGFTARRKFKGDKRTMQEKK